MVSQEARDALIQAFELWNQGNQTGAVERLRADADRGERTALITICWFLHQMGEPHWKEGVEYARAAISHGMPWVVNYYLGNMLSDANLRQQVPEMMASALEAGVPLDPMGYAPAPFQQGDPNTGVGLVEAATVPRPYPRAWDELVKEARQQFDDLRSALGDVSERRAAAVAAIEADEKTVSEKRDAVETRTSQLFTLLDQTTNAQAQTFFDAEATKYEREASSLWKWGLGVLSVAALLAVLPTIIYYVARVLGKDWLEATDLSAARIGPALALGAVAGVLLARSRGRDRARQRAKDLSVALGTMFVYSNQIASEEERQRFVSDMGPRILDTFLGHESPMTESERTSLLDALRRT